MDFEALAAACAEHNLTLKECGSGHWQIKGGAYLVNLYPFAKRPSIYIAGTRGGFTIQLSAEQIIQCALVGNPQTVKTERRSQGFYKRKKKRLLKSSDKCHWCGEAGLTSQTATIDHVIPLSKGGLDNLNNMVLSCDRCNKNKADKLPHEVSKQL